MMLATAKSQILSVLPTPEPILAPIPSPPPLSVMRPDHGYMRAVVAEAMLAAFTTTGRAKGRVTTAKQKLGMTQQPARVKAFNVHSFSYSRDTSDGAYYSGLQLLSRRDYKRALILFDQVVRENGLRADGAMYHTAYALYRLARWNEAAIVLADLRRNHPQSHYLKDASALEAMTRQSTGEVRSPEAERDVELKLLAINALVHAEPERALALLEGVINDVANSSAVKSRAIFVLSQSSQPRAKEILLSLAKGDSNVDVRVRAVEYLATFGRERGTMAELRQIYDSTTNADIKRAVVFAWSRMGATDELGHGAAAGTPAQLPPLLAKVRAELDEPQTPERMQRIEGLLTELRRLEGYRPQLWWLDGRFSLHTEMLERYRALGDLTNLRRHAEWMVSLEHLVHDWPPTQNTFYLERPGSEIDLIQVVRMRHGAAFLAARLDVVRAVLAGGERAKAIWLLETGENCLADISGAVRTLRAERDRILKESVGR